MKLTLEDLLVKFVADCYTERPNARTYKVLRNKAKKWIEQQGFTVHSKTEQVYDKEMGNKQ